MQKLYEAGAEPCVREFLGGALVRANFYRNPYLNKEREQVSQGVESGSLRAEKYPDRVARLNGVRYTINIVSGTICSLRCNELLGFGTLDRAESVARATSGTMCNEIKPVFL